MCGGCGHCVYVYEHNYGDDGCDDCVHMLYIQSSSACESWACERK